MRRRDFILASTAVAAAGALLPAVLQAARPLRILILGGTRFFGPHVAQYARARGHTLIAEEEHGSVVTGVQRAHCQVEADSYCQTTAQMANDVWLGNSDRRKGTTSGSSGF